MSCHLINCSEPAEFICLDCSSQNYFCKSHGTEHIITEKHKASGISEDIKKLLSLRESQMKIESYIAKITSDTNLLIKEIKQMSYQTINKLKEANKSVENLLEFQEIHFSQIRVDKMIKCIKDLDKYKKLYPEDIIAKEFNDLKNEQTNFKNHDFFETLKIIFKKVDAAIGEMKVKEEQAIFRSSNLKLLRDEIKHMMLGVFAEG